MVSDSFAAAVLGENHAANPRVPRKNNKFDRRFVAIKTCKMVDDSVVLESRRLFEQCNMTVTEIHKSLTAYGYDIVITTVRSWVEYTSRRLLSPQKNAKSYLK